ncbi:histidine kinase [Halobacteriales archaeon SW_6_65_15]|nr:MAG: histidine kinase [Halobacteriales archaeon SW_6_65_15]
MEDERRHRRIDRTFRGLTPSVVRTAEPAEFGRTVCDRLVDRGLYDSARFWTVERSGGALTLRARVDDGRDRGSTDATGERGRLAEIAKSAVRTTELECNREASDHRPDAADGGRPNTDGRSFAAVPLTFARTVHGVLGLSTSHPDAFDRFEADSLEELGTAIASALAAGERDSETGARQTNEVPGQSFGEDRADRREQQQKLDRLDSINDVIRDITQNLVDASTRAEIERVVCQSLVDTDRYRFVWIGRPDYESETVAPTAWSDAGAEYLEETDISIDDTETAKGPTGRAITTRQIQVTQNILEDPDYRPWRERARRYGYRSTAAIPLVHGDTLYGVLNLYAAEPRAFDDAERELLSELGETIPYAIDTIQTKERYQSFVDDVFDSSGVGIVILDDTFHVAWVNQAVLRYFGIEREKTVGRDGRRLVSDRLKHAFAEPEAFADRVVATYADNATTQEFECRVEPGPNRERRHLLHQSQPIESGFYEGGRLELYYDVTERKRRERELREKNDRLESFASMLAHELRNPVTIGQIYSQQLPNETDSEAVEYVAEAFDRIEEMIDVMLVLTRRREAVGERSSVRLAEVVREAWEDVEAPEATLAVDVDRSIQADETYVRHLFRNLLENAVEHGGSGVTVTVGGLPSGFYVADDGPGIPPEGRDAVFEAGYTTAAGQGGTGLGLAFVRELTDVYGWKCALTDSASGGARFEFTNVEQEAGTN